MKTDTNGLINELLSRGIENIYPNRDFLEKKMHSGEKVSLYLGIDPTGPTLHLGHMIIIKKLRDFQKLGHKVILLIGDFTGMIGDPTDKTATRKKLTREEVLKNATLYKEQASLFLNFSGENPAVLKYNSEWLGKMNFEDVLNLASHMTVDQMLKRDMFENRTKEGKPIFIHEFLYPLLQGYDSVAMNVDGEIGGNDQTFNMLTGRHLMKQLQEKEKFVLTTKLLADSTGAKMGKTTNNGVSLTDTPFEMFGKIMSWTDDMILGGFELCTDVSLAEIADMKAGIEKGENPKHFKMRLAKEVITLFFSKEKADEAEQNFNDTFKKGGISEDAEEVNVKAGEKLVDVLLQNKIVASKGELRRLVEEGAVSEVGGEKISSIDFPLERDIDLKVGKRRFLKVRVK